MEHKEWRLLCPPGVLTLMFECCFFLLLVLVFVMFLCCVFFSYFWFILFRKLILNQKEEQLLGTVQYCASLEDRRVAHEWLMKLCPEWTGVSPKKMRFWQSRIKSLRKKVNVGNAIFGKIPRLKNKKENFKSTSKHTLKKFQRLERWSHRGTELQNMVNYYKKNLSIIQHGHTTMGSGLTDEEVARNRQQEKASKKLIKKAKNDLLYHRSLIDSGKYAPCCLAMPLVV